MHFQIRAHTMQNLSSHSWRGENVGNQEIH